MPQPKRVERLAEELLATYGRSWERITRDEQALLNSWTGWNRTRRLARLRELRATVEALMDRADEQALRFTNEGLPEAYSLGAAAAGVGLSPFAQPDLDAIGVLTQDTYADLLSATGFVRDSTKALVRTLAREHVADKLVAGQTAVQAARDLARSLEGRGIAAVVYKDGSRHGLADYSNVVVRTKTAEAYTVGTMNQLEGAGIAYVEIFDGVGCGWTSHDDTDKANGTIRTLEEARAYPISHPRCRRSVGGRPDITSARQARDARPSTTPEQRADQAAAEMTRREQAVARAQRRRGGSFTDQGERVPSAAHANVLSRRTAKLDSRRARTTAPLNAKDVEAFKGGSAERHLVTDAQGHVRFTPERQALHDRIISDTLGDHAPQASPEYHLMGGGPASGKSTMMDKVATHDAAIINADDVKLALPEYATSGDAAAAFTHEESSYVAKRAIDEAFGRRINVTLDGTGNGTVGSLLGKIDSAREAGYSVYGHYVTVPTEVAVQRAELRAARTGRYVPRSVIEGTHQRVSQVLPHALPHFDVLDVYDNTTTLTRILRQDSTGLHVLDEGSWQAFLDKA